MKDDLISRSEVLAALSSRLSIVDMVRVAEIVESVPGVEAEPVVYGRWKGAGMGDYQCSVCDETVSGNQHRRCPHCGAHMDEEAE